MNKELFIAKISDNEDPDKLHRVKITFKILEETVSEWVPVISSFTGNDSGFFSLPDIDEQVLVAHIDNSTIPYCVIGSLWSNEIKPPASDENSDADFNQDGNNSLHFIKSRAGNKIIFDDTDSKEKIQIISADNTSRLEFSAEDELINLETENDIQISANGNIQLNAEEISIESSKETNISSESFQISSSKELNINADKDITIKGSGIALN